MELHGNFSFSETFLDILVSDVGWGPDEAKKCIFSHFYIKTFERKKSCSETMDFPCVSIFLMHWCHLLWWPRSTKFVVFHPANWCFVEFEQLQLFCDANSPPSVNQLAFRDANRKFFVDPCGHNWKVLQVNLRGRSRLTIYIFDTLCVRCCTCSEGLWAKAPTCFASTPVRWRKCSQPCQLPCQ